MLKFKAVRPSTHIWSGLAQVQISPNQTLRTLFHTPNPSPLLPLQYAWPRRLRSFHPHSHGNSFSLARGWSQPRVQLAGFTLEILFITLAAMLISSSVVLPLSVCLLLIVWCPASQYIFFLKIHGFHLNTYLYSVCLCFWLPSLTHREIAFVKVKSKVFQGQIIPMTQSNCLTK